MTWSTLVDFVLKIKAEPKLKRRIIEEAKKVFECEIEYDKQLDTYFCYNISWASHVSREKIDAFVKKYKKYIAEFKGDLYFLTAPHASWKIENN